MFVKNEVVRDNFWDVEDFFETKEDGYVAATHTYQTSSGPVLVIFKDRKAYLIVEDGETIGKERFKELLKAMFDNGTLGDDLDEVVDGVATVGIKGTIYDEEGYLGALGFSQADVSDIEDRMTDLENYWEETVTDF